MISCAGVPLGRPIDQKLVTMSVIAMSASNMAMSTYWPRAVTLALPQRGQDADGREQGRADVAESADRRDDRRLVALALELVDPAHRLDDRGERRPGAVGSRGQVAEARNRDVDAARVHRGDVVVAEAEPADRTRFGVLGDHVEVGREIEHQLPAARVLQVDADAALVEVVAQEGGADPAPFGVGHGRGGAPAQITRRRFDLHHVGAEPGQQLGRVRQRLHLLERQDAYTVERLATAGERLR